MLIFERMVPVLIVVWIFVLVGVYLFIKRTRAQKDYYKQKYKAKSHPTKPNANPDRKPDSRVIDDGV